MLLYYITDRRQFPGTATEQSRVLLAKVAEAASAGVDYIQLREKDLPIRELEQLAMAAATIIAEHNAARSASNLRRTALLINSRIDVALASGADGVHLTSTDLPASEARYIWSGAECANKRTPPIIAVSCHSVSEVQNAAAHGADFVVLAPIFEKIQTAAPGIGLNALRAATGKHRHPDRRLEAGDHRETVPVFALGGITLVNAQACIDAGAAGLAGIRLFQDAYVQTTINTLKHSARGCT